MTAPFSEDIRWKSHLIKIKEAILAGRAVPFLGPDINLCDRPKTGDGKEMAWTVDASFPPSNEELAVYLDTISAGWGPTYHRELSCPFAGNERLEQLPKECPLRTGEAMVRLPVQNISQFVSASEHEGDNNLYTALSELFAKSYAPNALHRFLASLPALLRSRSKQPIFLLMVTACFDSALEQAFEDAGEPIDLVSFVNDTEGGHFHHLAPDKTCKVIKDPNAYPGLDLRKRPAVLKLYGGYESHDFLITEDNYIDYLSHRDMASLVPTTLLEVLRADDTNLWFLGYSLSLWNQRVILRRLWQEKLGLSGKPWWAIQAHPEQLDLKIWKRYSVQAPLWPDLRLEDYIAELNERLLAVPKLASVSASLVSDVHDKPREGIFISYSHKDKTWLEQIKRFLQPAVRAGLVSEWDDSQIRTGSAWRTEIHDNLNRARTAVLLVTQDFLNSEFINSEELPMIMEEAGRNNLTLFPILVDFCTYDSHLLRDIQFENNPASPLASVPPEMLSKALVEIAHKIMDSSTKQERE
jgi:hypothetical protein